FVRAFDVESEASREILLVADHHVHVLGDLLVDRLRAFLTTNTLPQGGTIVEVIGNNGPVLLCFLDAFNHQGRRGVTERCEDTAGVKPAHSQPAENIVPIEVARLELARGGVAAVRNPHRAAHTKAAFGEIEAVADNATDPVKGHPLHKLGIHAALQNKGLDKPAHVIVRKSRGDGGLESETATQAAGNVVFAAAFPDLEFSRAANTAFTRVEAEHDFSQRQEVVFARAGGFNV